MDLDEYMNRFRLAGRELFNNFFRVEGTNDNDGWMLEERFSEVESLLFEKLVVEPASLERVRYGNLHPQISVELRGSDTAPVMLNRDVDSGYWDYPVREVTREARLGFVHFFDWDQLAYRDNRYVCVLVEEWPSQVDAVGKYALIETQYVAYKKI